MTKKTPIYKPDFVVSG